MFKQSKILTAMGLLAAVFCVSAANAQGFPARTIKWVVPSAPGDGSDSTARLLADKVSESLGQSVVVENKPGAGGILGSREVVRATADGYTMIVGNAGSHGINAAVYTKLGYDVVRDFTPVALICTAPNVMAVGQDSPVRSLAEFVSAAKVRGATMNYASGGNGSSSHMSMELLKTIAGFEMTQVPYKGATPAVTSVLSGESSVMIGNLPPWSAHLKSGRARALAVTSATRHPSLPDVPALAETYPGFETLAWFGILAPAGTSVAVVDQVNRAVNLALARDDVKARLGILGCDPAPRSPQAFVQHIDQEVTRWRKLAVERSIRLD